MNSSILEKRKKMMNKRSEVLQSMHIESSLESIKPLKKEKRKRQPVVVDESQRRKSRRIQGLEPEIKLQKEQEPLIEETETRVVIQRRCTYEDITIKGMEEPVYVNGYHGWLNPDVCDRYNIPHSEEELKQREMEGSSKSNKRRVEVSIKEWSKKQLLTQPNTYFYRHVEPNEEQWMGDWKEEEILAFYETAKKYGCGDKWGLFSSYIPHRVGYQCSNFYRQFFLPRGIIVDANYTIAPDGTAVYRPKRSCIC